MKTVTDDQPDHFRVDFEQFKLRPGVELDVHDDSGRQLEHRAQFVMAYPGKGVLVSIRANDPSRIAMRTGARYQLSGFNGRYDFSFTAEAEKVDAAQFTALFARPAEVTIRFTRKHERIPLALPATVASDAMGNSTPVTIRNLSLGGAAISSIQPLGRPGESLTLQMHVTFDGQKHPLKLFSVIRRSGHSDASLMFDTGLEFAHPTLTDKLLLHYYLSTVASDFNVI
ncbi:MAG TPA: PilZ domain-containing protein [Gallionellaceae bacterium]|nr:PilZ domain-containing protein [Gallionellaceae bacterium]